MAASAQPRHCQLSPAILTVSAGNCPGFTATAMLVSWMSCPHTRWILCDPCSLIWLVSNLKSGLGSFGRVLSKASPSVAQEANQQAVIACSIEGRRVLPHRERGAPNEGDSDTEWPKSMRIVLGGTHTPDGYLGHFFLKNIYSFMWLPPALVVRASWWLSGKQSACHVGDLGLTPGLGRSSGEGKGYPLQYSCLGNPMDRGAWRATVRGLQRVRHEMRGLSCGAWDLRVSCGIFCCSVQTLFVGPREFWLSTCPTRA